MPEISGRKTDASAKNGSLAHDQSGATAIEYALIAAGVGTAVAATVYSLGTTTNTLYTTIAGIF